jgi:hypothetical protein
MPRPRAEAERKRKEFEAWCRQHGYGKVRFRRLNAPNSWRRFMLAHGAKTAWRSRGRGPPPDARSHIS